MGNVGESVCEIPMGLNKIGAILTGGMNPIAAAEEAGIPAENRAISTLFEYQVLDKYDVFLNN